MTDRSTRVAQPPAAGDGSAERSWLRAGAVFVASSFVLLLLMQLVSGVWFPPPVSVSQYGIGPWGWLFSLWALVIAAGPVCLERAIPLRTTLGRVLLAGGAVGAVVMALIRTQAGGAQTTWNAKVHMVGAILAQGLLPLGILAVLWIVGGRWRWTATVLVLAVSVVMVLLLAAAGGADTAGLGPARSWAFWQAISVVLCQSLTVLMLAAAARFGTGRRSQSVVATGRNSAS